jgi:hypothetical protein
VACEAVSTLWLAMKAKKVSALRERGWRCECSAEPQADDATAGRHHLNNRETLGNWLERKADTMKTYLLRDPTLSSRKKPHSLTLPSATTGRTPRPAPPGGRFLARFSTRFCLSGCEAYYPRTRTAQRSGCSLQTDAARTRDFLQKFEHIFWFCRRGCSMIRGSCILE